MQPRVGNALQNESGGHSAKRVAGAVKETSMAKSAQKAHKRDRVFWSFIDVIRRLPFTRGKMRLFHQLLSQRSEHSTDHQFSCDVGVPLRWSSRGLPDLLTGHMLLTGSYQDEVIDALLGFLRPDDVMYDVGAHHGLMSVVAAQAVGSGGQVVAFEPNTWTRSILHQSLELNRVRDRVKVESCGLGDVQMERPFFALQGTFAWNSSFERAFADPQHVVEPINVQMTTLDEFVSKQPRAPNVIKIDTEGTEYQILSGSRNLLKQQAPKLVLELNPSSAQAVGHSLAEELDLLWSLDYEVFRLQHRRTRRADCGRLGAAISDPSHCSQDTLINVACISRRDPDFLRLTQ